MFEEQDPADWWKGAHRPQPRPIGPGRHAPAPLDPSLRLSDCMAEFMRRQEAAGVAPGTLKQSRLTLWSIGEFVACDPPRRELAAQTPAAYLDWLRTTPVAPRLAGSLPKRFTPESFRAFLRDPPRRKRAAPDLRSEQTCGRYWRHACPFFAMLDLDRRDRPNLDLPPPAVPLRSTVCDWWRDCLGGRHGGTPAERRRVVMTQALVLLTGMRIDECLAAREIQRGRESLRAFADAAFG
jgi:hypothetical protein